MDHVERVHTNERVPGHVNYYEKDGLRTQGDGIDHDAEPRMSFARMMSLVAMAFREHFAPQSTYWEHQLTFLQCGRDLKSQSTSLVVSIIAVVLQGFLFAEHPQACHHTSTQN